MNRKITVILLVAVLIFAMPGAAFADSYDPIEIDGYYDDWANRPHTDVYDGQKPKYQKISNVSMTRDEEYAYVHIVFAPIHTKSIFKIKVDLDTNMGGKTKSYYILPDIFYDSNGSGHEFNPGIYSDMQNEDQLNVNEEKTEIESTAPNETPLEQPQAEGENNTPADNQDNIPVDSQENPPADNQENPPADSQNNPTTDGENNPPADEPAGNNESNSTGTAVEGNPSENTNLEPSNDVLDPEEIVDLEDLQKIIEEEEQLETEQSFYLYAWPVTVYNRYGDEVGYGFYSMGYDGPDEAEFCIELSSVFNPPDAIADIFMHIKLLGKQEIICEGASTNPYIISGIGAGIALISLATYTYRKKRPLSLKKGI